LPKLQNPPNTPQEPRLSREVELRASTTIAPEGPAAENHPAARVLSLNFETMKLRTAPEEFGTQAVARLLSSLFHPERSKSLKLREEVELRECAAF